MLDLPSRIDIAAAAELFPLYRQTAEQPHDVQMNGSSVECCTGAGAQMLLSFSKTLSQSGHRLIIQQPSAALADDLHILGMTFLLGEGAHG